MPTRILVADDEEWVIRRVTSILQPCGYELESAADGREALDKLRCREFDLLILDVSMPYVDGIEVLLTVRREHARRVPIVMLTLLLSRVDECEEFHARLRERGADDCIIKWRLTPKGLIDTVQRLLAEDNPTEEWGGRPINTREPGPQGVP